MYLGLDLETILTVWLPPSFVKLREVGETLNSYSVVVVDVAPDWDRFAEAVSDVSPVHLTLRVPDLEEPEFALAFTVIVFPEVVWEKPIPKFVG